MQVQTKARLSGEEHYQEIFLNVPHKEMVRNGSECLALKAHDQIYVLIFCTTVTYSICLYITSHHYATISGIEF